MRKIQCNRTAHSDRPICIRPRLRGALAVQTEPIARAKKPGAGRPTRTIDGAPADKQVPAHDPHSLYLECKQAFQFEPSLQAIEEAKSQEGAGFYMAVADYFLQHKQRELIAQGVY